MDLKIHSNIFSLFSICLNDSGLTGLNFLFFKAITKQFLTLYKGTCYVQGSDTGWLEFND